jgi:hypothetical protein
MIQFWKSLTYTTKFSAIAFIVIGALGLLSMGLLGAVLYYPVSFLFNSYPTLNDWHGDWVWPAIIVAGMAWSFGFVFGGIAWHFLRKKISSIALLRFTYIGIMWLWDAIIWFVIISSNVEPL